MAFLNCNRLTIQPTPSSTTTNDRQNASPFLILQLNGVCKVRELCLRICFCGFAVVRPPCCLDNAARSLGEHDQLTTTARHDPWRSGGGTCSLVSLFFSFLFSFPFFLCSVHNFVSSFSYYFYYLILSLLFLQPPSHHTQNLPVLIFTTNYCMSCTASFPMSCTAVPERQFFSLELT